MKEVISIQEELGQTLELWKPLILSRGDFQFRFVKFNGEFEWHQHVHSDKVILVIEGEMRVDFKDKESVVIRQGEMYVIDKNAHHRPASDQDCSIVLIEMK